MIFSIFVKPLLLKIINFSEEPSMVALFNIRNTPHFLYDVTQFEFGKSIKCKRLGKVENPDIRISKTGGK